MNNIGIDVSDAQGNIDFDLITAEYMIIRVGVGSDIASQDDNHFARNVAECTRKGIPYGLYLYSYALNMDECLSEVKHFLRLYNSISDKSMLKLGLWFDMEDADHYKAKHGQGLNENGALYSQFCNTWVDEVKKATGEIMVGVYASLSPLRSCLSGVRSDIPKWVACWIDGKPDTSTPLFPNAYFWQYTNSGKMDGVYSRGLDMDISYIDIPSVRPTPQPTPTPTPTTNHSVGETVSFNAIYSSSTSTNALTPAVTSGVITKVIEGANNPYLINDGTGWVNDGCIVGGSPAPAPTPTPSPSTSHNVGDYVHFNKIYVSSTSTDALTPAVTEGTITDIIAGTNNPYLINNGTGWINDSCITSGGVTPTPSPAPTPSISVGSNIMIRNGATDMNTGDTYGDWVYNTVYQVKEISGNRVVFGDDSGITGATDIANCYLV